MVFFARSLTFLLFVALCPLRAGSTDNLVLILDASGSMWGKLQNETKIEAARRVVRDLSGKLADDARLGLFAYGHRQKGDCNDIEQIVAPGSASPSAVPDRVDALNPLGMTPITRAFEQAAQSAQKVGKPGTIVLVTDGLETCGGDPCGAVKRAKAAGMDFVLHVVGFDVAKENVSSLECSAQAGGGLYLPAANADQLSAALEQTMTEAAPVGDATLAVKSIVDGKLHDAAVIVRSAGMPEVGGRTYAAPETNPRQFALPVGTYDILVRPVAVQGGAEVRFEGVTLEAGKVVEKVADFSTGELAVTVTRNGELSDATVSVHPAGDRKQLAGGRTYRAATSNPRVFRLPPGVYDVRVGVLELANEAPQVFEKVEVKAGGRAERSHTVESGTLKIGAVLGGELIDATVTIRDAAGQSVKGGRTYTDAKTNPRSQEVLPGKYTVTVRPVRPANIPPKTVEIEVPARGEATKVVEFGP